MISGDTSKFAIEWELDPTPVKSGIVRMWGCGLPIGDYDATVTLSVVWAHFKWFLSYTGARSDDDLGSQVPAQAMSFVWDSQYDIQQYGCTNATFYRRFLLCPGAGPPFDRFKAIYQEMDNSLARLVWQGPDQTVRVCILKQGLLDEAIHGFMRWCETNGIVVLAERVVRDPIGETIHLQANVGKRMLLRGEFYRGFLEIAKAYTNKWGRRDQDVLESLAELRISDADIYTLRGTMEASLENIERVLSIGEVFQPEELLQVLQQRSDIQLIMAMLKGYFNINLEID